MLSRVATGVSDVLSACEGLDDEHRGAAVPADDVGRMGALPARASDAQRGLSVVG